MTGAPPRPTPRWRSSLRWRLLAATLAALAVALTLAGLMLASLFREHVMSQFENALRRQLDQLTAQLEFDASGQPQIDTQTLTDPRWQRPFGGLYWQIDRLAPAADGIRPAVLRSRSLWDTTLQMPDDAVADGVVHVHEGHGPRSVPVLMLERSLSVAEQPGTRWRLVVASETQEAHEAVARFNSVLAASLGLLGALLAIAALAQVSMGLAPLRALQTALKRVREGQDTRLHGDFAAEIQPLIDDFNGVLDRNAEIVARARTQAGNLAHALKTPLTVLSQAASQQGNEASAPLARLVQEQTDTVRRQVDWHLARARAAGAQRLPGLRTPLAPTVAGLVRVMQRVHADRDLSIDMVGIPPTLSFAGEEQDLQEMLGNLLDNACKWARHTVRIQAQKHAPMPGSNGPGLQLEVVDDGPGIAPDVRQAVLARGARLDESMAGSGLGLAIVDELAQLYGGRLALETAPGGGLLARLTLPAAA